MAARVAVEDRTGRPIMMWRGDKGPGSLIRVNVYPVIVGTR